MKVSIIVPAYNERENVRPLLDECKEVFDKYGLKDWEVIYVDDGSTDGTYEEVKKYLKDYNFLKVAKHSRNLGKSAAIMTGFYISSGEYIAILDADLQFKVEDVVRMVDHMEKNGYDLVTGKKVGKYEKAFVSQVYNLMNRWLFGVPVSDMNSLKVVKREVLEDIPLRKEWHRYIVALAWVYGYSVGEIEITLRPRLYGVSKYRGMGRIFVGVADLIAVKLYTVFIQKPLLTFGGIGIVFFFTGFITGVIALILRLMGHGYRPLLFLVLLLIILGTIFWVLGLLGEVVASIYDEVRKIKKYIRRGQP
ncbi:MAG: glycosyltransferase family 2 protein [candidate division WOR-3 bacterium]